MNTWVQVEKMLNTWKQQGLNKIDTCVNLANACIGWSYVFGARGTKCTPANRRAWYNSKKKETIKSKCKNFSGSSTCSGCKWYPSGVTLFYDCRGWTYWLFLKAAGIEIKGGGATSQWNDDSNWAEKGSIADMPKNKICCTFRWDGKSMAHTLFYDGQGHYIHDSGEVKKVDINKYAATHYAIPKGLYDSPIPPTPVPPIPVPPAPEPGKAIVSGKNVALREGPSTSTKVLIRIATGTTVDITPQSNDWAYVSYGTRTGFMMKAYLRKENDSYIVTGKNVALRAGPSLSTTVMTRIATGKTVKAASHPTGWEHITYGSRTGFMMKEFLRE